MICHLGWIWLAFLFCGKEEGRILQMLEGTVVVGSNHYVLGWSHPKSWLILVGCTICLSVGPYLPTRICGMNRQWKVHFSLWRFSMAMGENHCNWSQRSKRRQQLNWNPTICRTCTCRCLFFVICWITQPLLKKRSNYWLQSIDISTRIASYKLVNHIKLGSPNILGKRTRPNIYIYWS